VNLTTSQTQQFTATVTGTSNTKVTWSLNPAVGALSSTGLYTAPATINAGQSVIITATSVADASQSANASVNLLPPPVVKIGPTSVNLTASQTQQFTATVTGTSNTKVTWSLNPVVGALSSTGLYTAPETINAGQTVVITATSAADAAQSASSIINLQPVPDFSITAQPGFATLRAGQSATITLSIAGTGGFGSLVILSCGNLPSSSTCTFTPPNVTAGSSPVNSTLVIQTAGTAVELVPTIRTNSRAGGLLLSFTGFAAVSIVLLGIRLRKREAMLVMLAIALMLRLSSCGGGSSSGPSTPLAAPLATPLALSTPTGMASVAVVATSSVNGATITHQVPVSIMVTP
jgi:hypothetical protein